MADRLSPDQHARTVRSLFGRIAGRYDLLNHILSLGQAGGWRRRLARHACPDGRGLVLDLAAGTLDAALEILRMHPEARVLAADFSLPMLRRGLGKASSAERGRLAPLLADGRRLPLADRSVDCVTTAFGIRNMLPRDAVYAEALRVLRPGGRLCVLEFGSARQPIWLGLYNGYLRHVLPRVGRLLSGDAAAYLYLAETIASFPAAGDLAGEMRRAGFVEAAYAPLFSGIVYLHVARKGPGGAA